MGLARLQCKLNSNPTVHAIRAATGLSDSPIEIGLALSWALVCRGWWRRTGSASVPPRPLKRYHAPAPSPPSPVACSGWWVASLSATPPRPAPPRPDRPGGPNKCCCGIPILHAMHFGLQSWLASETQNSWEHPRAAPCYCLIRARVWRLAGAAAGFWDDDSVSSCRSYGRAKGSGASTGAFPMALSLSAGGPRGPRQVSQGVLWDPRDPLS
jgi:hypothetical protein